MIDTMIKQITETPLDCTCKGDGIIHKTKEPCPKHFLYAVDEEFREISLTLVVENFQATIIHLVRNHEALRRHREVGFPQDKESLEDFVSLFWNPQTIEDKVKAHQTFTRLILDFISRFKAQNPPAKSVDLFSFGEFSFNLESQFIWKPLFTDEQ